MRTEAPREYKIWIIDRDGKEHIFFIHHYEFTAGHIQLWRSKIGIMVEMVEDVELKTANMELIGVFTDIGGFWIEGVDDGETESN